MKEKILMVFFTVVYFLIFCYFIDLVFRNTLSIYSDVLVIAFIISVALADHTVKKPKDQERL